MKWDNETGLQVPGTYQSKNRQLERLFLSGIYHSQLGSNPVLGVLSVLLEDNMVSDENLANHYKDIVSGHLNVLHYPEIACRLFFCDTEEDIWDIVKDGYANAESFLLTYGGYHRTRLEQEPIFTASAIRQERFCRYVQDAFPWLKPMHEFLQNVSYTFSPEEFSIGNWIGK